jgi:predicted transcriptional regulator
MSLRVAWLHPQNTDFKMAIREATRRLRRDVKAVHGDVHALINAGIIQKTETGQIVFPYDAIHVYFMLEAA